MDNLKLNFELTLAEVNVILAGLGKLPLEAVLTVYENLKTQAQPQIQAAENASQRTSGE
jgi:exonuclease VII small subunit